MKLALKFTILLSIFTTIAEAQKEVLIGLMTGIYMSELKFDDGKQYIEFNYSPGNGIQTFESYDLSGIRNSVYFGVPIEFRINRTLGIETGLYFYSSDYSYKYYKEEYDELNPAEIYYSESEEGYSAITTFGIPAKVNLYIIKKDLEIMLSGGPSMQVNGYIRMEFLFNMGPVLQYNWKEYVFSLSGSYIKHFGNILNIYHREESDLGDIYYVESPVKQNDYLINLGMKLYLGKKWINAEDLLK